MEGILVRGTLILGADMLKDFKSPTVFVTIALNKDEDKAKEKDGSAKKLPVG